MNLFLSSYLVVHSQRLVTCSPSKIFISQNSSSEAAILSQVRRNFEEITK